MIIMEIKNLFLGAKKNLLIGALMLISFLILLPQFIFIINNQMAPYTDDEVVITTVSYRTKGLDDVDDDVIAGHLFRPAPKFTNKRYPAIIAVHGFLAGIGKESMNRWAVELAKRGFVVLTLDMPGNGMSLGEADMLPREDFEPIIIEDGISYLKGFDFVDGDHIGLMGISFGGATVSLVSGVLGSKVDATVSMNGFMNVTNWLIEGILPENDVKFSVKEDFIELKQIGDKEVTKENIGEFLDIYEIARGNPDVIEDLIIDGTTRLDRNFLKKFNAVEYLPDAKNDSVMFIHSQRDSSFDDTNQSGQAYDVMTAAGKKAYYISVDDNHQLLDDPDYVSDYCIINFFEEKLMGEDLGDDWDTPYDKYSQERDIKLTYAKVFNFDLFTDTVILFFISLLPFVAILLIILYNKQAAVARAETEERLLNIKDDNDEFVDFSFGRGSYGKMVIYLALAYAFMALLIWGAGLGLFSDLIVGALGAAFFVVTYLALYYLPDQAEVDLWKSRKEEKEGPNPYEADPRSQKILDINAFFYMGAMALLVVIGGLIGWLSYFIPNYFQMPFEGLFRGMLIVGLYLLIAGVLTIYKIEAYENEGITFRQIQWNRYGLSRYQLSKGFCIGSVFFLTFYIILAMFAHYAKFPMMMGPHSFFYLFMVLAVVLFFGGFQVIVHIVKQKTFLETVELDDDRDSKQGVLTRILVNCAMLLIGGILLAVLVYFSFFELFSFDLLGDLTWGLVIAFVFIYILSNTIHILNIRNSSFGITVFLPLLLISIIMFFFHI